MDNNVKLNDDVQGLINAVNSFFPGTATVTFIGQLQAGYVRHDQAQVVQDKDKLMVQIADLSAPNYTASHELLHLLMVLRGFPQLFFSLTTSNKVLDNQIKAVGTELYDIVSHFVVVAEQRKHNLIDDEIESMYLKGIYETIKPETASEDTAFQAHDTRDYSMPNRLMTLVDAMVFYGDGFGKVASQLTTDFPVAFAAAEKIYAEITKKPTDSPFGLRRNVVKLFKIFDDQLKAWGFPAIHNSEFTTLTSVLSKRQLNMAVKGVFEIFHSELHEAKTNTRGYVGFNRTDDQNSFVIPSPTGKNDNPDYFKSLYSQTVKELLDTLKMPYIVRE